MTLQHVDGGLSIGHISSTISLYSPLKYIYCMFPSFGSTRYTSSLPCTVLKLM